MNLKVEQLSKKSSKVNNKEKNELKKNKQSLRDLLHDIKQSNTLVNETPEKEKKENGAEKTLRKKKKFPKFDTRQKFASTKCQMNTK